VMVTPTPQGQVNPAVLAAAHIAGVDEIWRIGGAQAVGALAYGTARIAPVDVVVGPGNAWVAEAKRQLYGRVGIDMVAGPSEILVVADAENDPAWIAADLLSQAEHDPTSQSILITDDAAFAGLVIAEVERLLETIPAARPSWHDHAIMLILPQLSDASPLIDRLAPEHLELAVADPESLFARVRHAGSVFLGRHTHRLHEAHQLPVGQPRRHRRDWPGGGDAGGRRGLARARCLGQGTAMSRSKARAAARLAAVQALYQRSMEATPVTTLLHEFHQHRLGATIEDAAYNEAEVAFFDDVVQGAVAREAELDAAIAVRLSSGWSLERLDKPMRALLRAATYELLARPDVPVKTVINEYVDVADAFYEAREKGFVNGLLDAVAKDLRP
jgi:transcription antitermination factor NusB